MSEHNAPTDPQTAEAVVRDPDDYAQTERLRQIYSAREDFREALTEAEELRRENGWKLVDKQKYLQRVLQRYFFEVEGLIEQHENSEYYLKEAFLGGLATPETEKRLDLSELRAKAAPDGPGITAQMRSALEEKDGTLVWFGLQSISSPRRPIRTSGYGWSRSGEKEDRVVYACFPERVATRSYRLINSFLADVGLDADVEPESQDAGFEYDDLLDDGADPDPPEMVSDGGTNE